jgi:MFS family permease
MRPGVGKAWTVLSLVNVLNIYDRQVLGAVLEPLRREFRLTDAQLGALATIFIVVYAVAGLPLGRLADTWSRKRLLALGVGIWCTLTGAGALATSYTMLFVTRIGVGIGEAVCAPAATSWIGDIVPVQRRARALAGFMMAVPIGVMLSFAISGPVAQAHGWRLAMALAAAPSLILVPALLTLDEPIRKLPAHSASAPIATIIRIPALWWLAVSGALLNFILYSFSTFISPLLSRYHGLSVAQAGVWSGLGSGAAGILGAAVAAWQGDRRTGSGRVTFAAVAALAAAPVAAVAFALPPGTATQAITLLMLAYGLLQMYYGLIYAAIQDIVPPHLRGLAMAAYLMAMYLCGGALGPFATGALSDYFAGPSPTEAARAAGLHQAMYVIPVLSVALAVVLWIAARATGGTGFSLPGSPPRSRAA